eukprot:SAG11_NODE_911_length_6582_cov_9.565633_5_plen_243_part_00
MFDLAEFLLRQAGAQGCARLVVAASIASVETEQKMEQQKEERQNCLSMQRWTSTLLETALKSSPALDLAAVLTELAEQGELAVLSYLQQKVRRSFGELPGAGIEKKSQENFPSELAAFLERLDLPDGVSLRPAPAQTTVVETQTDLEPKSEPEPENVRFRSRTASFMQPVQLNSFYEHDRKTQPMVLGKALQLIAIVVRGYFLSRTECRAHFAVKANVVLTGAILFFTPPGADVRQVPLRCH